MEDILQNAWTGQTRWTPLPAMEEEDEDPLAENHCTVDRTRYFEAVRALSGTGRSRALAVMGVIFVPVGLMIGSQAVAGIAALAAVVSVASRPMIGLRDYRRLKRIHPDGTWTKEVRIYDDRVETSADEDDVVTVVPVDRLKRIRETEHLCILDFGKEAPATLLAKDGFSKGSADDLKMLLRAVQRTEADRRAEADPEEIV